MQALPDGIFLFRNFSRFIFFKRDSQRLIIVHISEEIPLNAGTKIRRIIFKGYLAKIYISTTPSPQSFFGHIPNCVPPLPLIITDVCCLIFDFYPLPPRRCWRHDLHGYPPNEKDLARLIRMQTVLGNKYFNNLFCRESLKLAVLLRPVLPKKWLILEKAWSDSVILFNKIIESRLTRYLKANFKSSLRISNSTNQEQYVFHTFYISEGINTKYYSSQK